MKKQGNDDIERGIEDYAHEKNNGKYVPEYAPENDDRSINWRWVLHKLDMTPEEAMNVATQMGRTERENLTEEEKERELRAKFAKLKQEERNEKILRNSSIYGIDRPGYWR